ncbi:MAG: flagellar biosynthesis anti-sigma factor FlgM [Thermomicrobiales bacterium]
MVDRVNPASGDQSINRPTDSGPTRNVAENRGTAGVGDARTGSVANQESTARVASDSVDISGEAAFRSRALEAVREAPDVREDRVQALRQAIASGNYNVTSADLAAHLLGQAGNGE